MRSKIPLILMEQLVMIFVFAVAAAICLKIFVSADQTSRKNEAVSQAVFLAQDTAERIKSSRLEPTGKLVIYYNDNWQETSREESWKYCLEITEEKTSVKGLACARIKIWDEDEILFQIPAAWQEDYYEK